MELLIFLAVIFFCFSGRSGGSGYWVDCLTAEMKKVLHNPANTYVVRWTLLCGIGRDFEYKLVYDENFIAKIQTGDIEIDAQIKREIAEIERLSKTEDGGVIPSKVIKKCKNAA